MMTIFPDLDKEVFAYQAGLKDKGLFLTTDEIESILSFCDDDESLLEAVLAWLEFNREDTWENYTQMSFEYDYLGRYDDELEFLTEHFSSRYELDPAVARFIDYKSYKLSIWDEYFSMHIPSGGVCIYRRRN